MRKLNHFGVPTQVVKEGENYSPDMRLFLTDYSKSPNRIEFLRFEPESTMPELLKTHAHIAYEVEDIVAATEGQTIVLPITKLSDELTIAFIEEEGIAIELMQFTK
ncbi:hypothetical protein BN938_0049 [Mucinivorans hirudinis]|uniref:Uncharacterized protein n=1 Tax=Mucinivorans hirudinis TaxID=1433126 RepID=A0A060R5N4_9BACT|nr:hypothetical protein BN938_0049 [Mucinivorans hirudinis]